MRLEQLAAANAAPTHRISLRIAPQSGYSLTTTISFAPEIQRRKLIVAPRSKPVSERDMGAGDKQWSALNVTVERKKNRCAECTRPLPEGSTTSACQRCQQTSLASASPPNADISTSGGGGDKVRLSIAVLPNGVAGNRVNLDIACLTSSAPRKAKKKEKAAAPRPQAAASAAPSGSAVASLGKTPTPSTESAEREHAPIEALVDLSWRAYVASTLKAALSQASDWAARMATQLWEYATQARLKP